MSETTLRPSEARGLQPVGDAAPRPATSPDEPTPLALAISACLLGNPHQAVVLARDDQGQEIAIRSETLVKALAPELLERIEALLAPEPESISADAMERIRSYVVGFAA